MCAMFFIPMIYLSNLVVAVFTVYLCSIMDGEAKLWGAILGHSFDLADIEPNNAVLENPTTTGLLRVGPSSTRHHTSDVHFMSQGGRLAYLHLYINDPYDGTSHTAQSIPECKLTICINGEPLVTNLNIHEMQARTNLDLSQALSNTNILYPMDVISAELSGGLDMYQCVAIGYGLL
jgi:hypothetical protein